MVKTTTVEPVSTQNTASNVVTNNKTADCNNDSRATNSNTSSETASLPDEQEQQDLLLSLLARQLEFYFSPSNLSRDTYLQTLQSLNDGYVPISIVANFAKVQAICSSSTDEQARIQAVIKAASMHTGLLEVVSISTFTNKKVEGNSENTILAVGPATQPSPLLLSPRSPIQNTIILREVPEDAKEEDVRRLFEENEACPPLQEVRLDVANCWFVTLDTTSRDDMMQVMLDLRQKTLLGDPVKARLKTAATPTVSLDPSVIPFPAMHAPSPPDSPARNNKDKTKSRGKNKNGRRRSSRSRGKNSNANKQQQPPSSSPSTPKKQQQVSKKQVDAPPKLEEESHFPALATPSVAVDNIADKVHADKVAGNLTKAFADGASTATTASSATSSTSTPVSGGYAAALLKAAPPKDEATTNGSVTTKMSGRSTPTSEKLSDKSAQRPETVSVEKIEEPKETITAMPMSWGSGKSFAQVLKKEEQSS